MHGTDGPATEPRPRRRKIGLVTSLMLVVLTCALVGATGLCLGLAGIVLAVWPPAVIDALKEGALAERAAWLSGGLVAALAVWALVWMSWRAFARAKTGRCADFMIAALVATLGLHAVLTGGLG